MKMDPATLTIDLNSLVRGTNNVKVTLPIRQVEWGIDDVEPVGEEGILNLVLQFTGDSVACGGTLEAAFSTPCARCLEPAVFRTTEEIYRVYSSDPDIMESGEVGPFEVEDGSLSILDAVREAVVLSIPGKPLCRPDCPGIHYI